MMENIDKIVQEFIERSKVSNFWEYAMDEYFDERINANPCLDYTQLNRDSYRLTFQNIIDDGPFRKHYEAYSNKCNQFLINTITDNIQEPEDFF